MRDNPIDLRSVGPLSVEAERDPSLRTTRNLVWLRVDGELPDDPLLHVCLMTYASDMTLLDSVLLGHGLSWVDGRTSGASLDHAMWFHRPFRADRWLLYAQDSPVAHGARGLAHGEVFTAEGELVVSVMQEGLIRAAPAPAPAPPRPPSPASPASPAAPASRPARRPASPAARSLARLLPALELDLADPRRPCCRNGPGQRRLVSRGSAKPKIAGQKSVAPFGGQHLGCLHVRGLVVDHSGGRCPT